MAACRGIDMLRQLFACCGLHRGDEPVAELRHRLDAARVVLAIAERLADQPDVLGQVGFVDETARPERAHKLVLADHVAGMLDQQHEPQPNRCKRHARRSADGERDHA